MTCPECGGEQFCPCDACKIVNTGRTVWRWADGELIACGHCGHTMHADGWGERAYKEYLADKARELILRA